MAQKPRPKKEKDALGAEISSAPGIPNPMVETSAQKRRRFRRSARPRRRDLANRLLAELQRLNNNSFLVVAEATAKRHSGSDEHDSGDNALKTLHGLLSFG